MDAPWPPPTADDLGYGSHGRPNYALRRIGALVVVVALVGGGLWFAFGRGGDDGETSSAGATSWDRVVLQRADGTVTVHDRDGEVVASAETDLLGVTDIGIPGSVLLGLDGTPSADGLGVLSLDDGSIEAIEVSYDLVERLGRSQLLTASDPAGTGLELVDPATGTVTDLLALADGTEPLTDLTGVRVDDQAAFVAFTELRSFETVVVDVAAGTGASLPGSLADLAFGRVLTVTNRGDTVLVDLNDTAGTRVGTVETDPVAAVMLTDDDTAIAVSATGVVSRLEFGDESVEQVVDLSTVLPVPPGTDPATDPELVLAGTALSERTRLALYGERFVAFLGADGALVRSVDVPDRVLPFLEPGVADRCVLVGQQAGTGPYTLIDAEAGVIVTSFDDGTLVGDSADGCVVAFASSGADADVVAGIELDERLDDDARAVAADGTAAVQAAGTTAAIVDLAGGDTTELAEPEDGTPRRVQSAAFAHA